MHESMSEGQAGRRPKHSSKARTNAESRTDALAEDFSLAEVELGTSVPSASRPLPSNASRQATGGGLAREVRTHRLSANSHVLLLRSLRHMCEWTTVRTDSCGSRGLGFF